MRKTAYCKINLTLEILGTRRNDGFHDLKTVMHKIPLGDIIELSADKGGDGKITLDCDKDVCEKEDNLAYKAAKLFLEEYRGKTGRNADVSIRLNKITPFGAGLGGGSADAAAVLDMLGKELGEMTDGEILFMAQRLGSDVPFCLERYISAYCTGRGEICRSISSLPDSVCIIVAKPLEGINTKGIYAEYDKAFGDDYTKDASEKMENALEKGSLLSISQCMINDFEGICIPRLLQIESIKEAMLRSGAAGSMMSGSGSAVYGLFDDENKCRKCFEKLKSSGLHEVYLLTDADFQRMYKGE